jgi:hypothetical protein
MKTKASSEAVRFTTIKEANLGIHDAYSKAESFLQSLFIVTCYRMPWESFTGFGFYEGSDPPDNLKLFQSIRKTKADALQEALQQLQFTYQQTILAFVPIFPMLEIALPKIGLFRNAVHARFFFEEMKIRAENWGHQFLSFFKSDLAFPIVPPSRLLTDAEISKRNQQREIENREWSRLRDTINRLNEELPFTGEDQQEFLNRLKIEKGQLLRDLPAYFPILEKPETLKNPEQAKKEKKYLDLLAEYDRWKEKTAKETNRKKLSPRDWLADRKIWKQKTERFFKVLCSKSNFDSGKTLDNAIRYARTIKKKSDQE